MVLPDNINPHVLIKDTQPEKLPSVFQDLEHWLGSEDLNEDIPERTNSNNPEDLGHPLETQPDSANDASGGAIPGDVSLPQTSPPACSCTRCNSLRLATAIASLALLESERTPNRLRLFFPSLLLALSALMPQAAPGAERVRRSMRRKRFRGKELSKAQKKTRDMKIRLGTVKIVYSPLLMAELAAKRFANVSPSGNEVV